MAVNLRNPFPIDAAAKRDVLLSALDSVRDVLAAEAAPSRAARTLTPTALAALRDSGLLLLKVPTILGGAEADPMVQFDVLEAITKVDPGTAWCTMISSAVTGITAVRCTDEAFETIFGDAKMPSMAGTLRPSGQATKVDGGFVVTGRWSWGSGILHADWVGLRALADEDGDRLVYSLTVPIDQITVHDNWHVMGMESTGSCDYSVEDLFVPDAFAVPDTQLPRRGGPLHLIPAPGFVVNEHAAIAVGIAQRSLDCVVTMAVEKARGYGGQRTLADREVLQRDIARADLRLRADRELIHRTLEPLWDAVCAGRAPTQAMQADARAAAVLANDDALEVAAMAMRYGAGSAVFVDQQLQQNLRDLTVAATHLMVSDIAYEDHGKFLLGTTDRITM